MQQRPTSGGDDYGGKRADALLQQAKGPAPEDQFLGDRSQYSNGDYAHGRRSEWGFEPWAPIPRTAPMDCGVGRQHPAEVDEDEQRRNRNRRSHQTQFLARQAS